MSSVRRRLLAAIQAAAAPFTFGSDPSALTLAAATGVRFIMTVPGTGTPWVDPIRGGTITTIKASFASGGQVNFFSITSAGIVHDRTAGIVIAGTGITTITGLTLAVPAGGSVGVFLATGYAINYYAGGTADVYIGSVGSTTALVPNIGDNMYTRTGSGPNNNLHMPMLCTAH